MKLNRCHEDSLFYLLCFCSWGCGCFLLFGSFFFSCRFCCILFTTSFFCFKIITKSFNEFCDQSWFFFLVFWISGNISTNGCFSFRRCCISLCFGFRLSSSVFICVNSSSLDVSFLKKLLLSLCFSFEHFPQLTDSAYQQQTSQKIFQMHFQQSYYSFTSKMCYPSESFPFKCGIYRDLW